MAEINLNGLGVALITPFHKDLSIDFNALANLIENLISGGTDYIVALGTTAETPTLTVEEKQSIAKFIREKVNGRIPLVIGIGGNSTTNVVKEIRNFDLTGYNAILSVTPYYNKPTQEGLFLHYKAVCDASPIPIVLYNVPGRTGVNMSPATTIKLAEYSEKFIAIKEASGKVDQCEKIIADAPHGFSLISGDDALTYDLMQRGAIGVISVLGNALPHIVKDIIKECVLGHFDRAYSLQNKIHPLITRIFEDGNPSGVKALLAHLGLVQNILRLPLVPVSKNVEEKIIKEVSTFL